jgi:hypothetical protein
LLHIPIRAVIDNSSIVVQSIIGPFFAVSFNRQKNPNYRFIDLIDLSVIFLVVSPLFSFYTVSFGVKKIFFKHLTLPYNFAVVQAKF